MKILKIFLWTVLLCVFISPLIVHAAKIQYRTVDGIKIGFYSEPSLPQAGNNIFRFIIKDSKGIPIKDANVEVKYSMPEMPGMGGDKIKAVLTKNQEYAFAAELGMKGEWEIAVRIKLPNKKNVETIFKLTIK